MELAITTEALFVLSIRESIQIDERTMLTQAIQTALIHYREQDSTHKHLAVNGFAAYAAWKKAYEKGAGDIN